MGRICHSALPEPEAGVAGDRGAKPELSKPCCVDYNIFYPRKKESTRRQNLQGGGTLQIIV